MPTPAVTPRRPTIGVALSGGAAKGCAHVGVLRVLEEMRVPVDDLAGTSMGAVIGGLYATGMSADELERTVLSVDWADALRDKPSRKDLVFRRKDDDLHYIPDFELGIGKGGIKLPAGLRSGQKLGYLLRRFTVHVRTVRDFSDLPVPFRAVATEVATGNGIVLDHGDLARAIRASMAIPTVFTPVEIEGKLLVDGGLADNVPVDVARAMGADVVIAIDVGSQFAGEAEAGKSFISILNQTGTMITRKNMIASLAASDLVITPDVGSIKPLDFARAKEAIDLGEAAARRVADRLRAYALSEEDYAAWKASRRREPDSVPVVTAIAFEGNRRVDTRVLEAQIRLRPGSEATAEGIRRDLSRLYGLGDFESVDVELEPNAEGTALVYHVREKPWGSSYVRAGIGVEIDDEGRSDFELLGSINRTRIDARGAEWRTRLQFGSLRSIDTEFYQPLDFRGGWFVAPSLFYARQQIPLFDSGLRLAEFDVPVTGARFDLGYMFGRYGELRVGVERSVAHVFRSTGIPPPELSDLVESTFNRAGLQVSGVVDRLDSATLPKNGGLFQLVAFHSVPSLGADSSYDRFELRSSVFRTWGRHTVFGGLNGGISPGGELPIYDQFALGGFFSLSGYRPGELRGDNYALARLGYYYRIWKIFHLGGYVEAGSVAPEAGDLADDPVYAETVVLTADTRLGPLYVALGNAGPGKQAFYLFFGRQF